MKLIVILALFAAPLVTTAAPLTLPTAPVARSVSGQFIVYDARYQARGLSPAGLAVNTNLLELDPALLVVSCERVKQELGRVLAVTTPWRGKIQILIQPARSADDLVTIVSERFRDGWSYRINFPHYVERTRFIRALVQTLLLELANRNAGEKSAEIPVWLVEGLTQQLLGSRESKYLLPPPRAVVGGVTTAPLMIETRDRDPLAAARRILRRQSPLTIAELSWPTDAQLTDGIGAAYRGSAQLFVAELLRLKDGPANLRAMLDELPGCYNWQTAFLRAFHGQFNGPLALEKWWSLQVVHFTGREPTQLWTAAESWQKLDRIIRTPVAVRRAASELPAHAEVTLQAIIREWSMARQELALREKLRDLELLQPRIAPEFAELVDNYRQALATYLKRRSQAKVNLFSPRQARPDLQKLVNDVIAELDALDTRRETLRPAITPVTARATVRQPAADQ